MGLSLTLWAFQHIIIFHKTPPTYLGRLWFSTFGYSRFHPSLSPPKKIGQSLNKECEWISRVRLLSRRHKYKLSQPFLKRNSFFSFVLLTLKKNKLLRSQCHDVKQWTRNITLKHCDCKHSRKSKCTSFKCICLKKSSHCFLGDIFFFTKLTCGWICQ